jgi:hypothetical protein
MRRWHGRAGLSIHTVRDERKRRGVAPIRTSRPAIDWTEDMDALLATDTDTNVGASLGVSGASVARRRRLLGIAAYRPDHERPRTGRPGRWWTARELALLGTAPDAAIAARLGISATTVSFKRQRLRIPPYAPTPARIRWTPAMIRLLGTRPDPELARKFGVGVRSVQDKRRTLRIRARSFHGFVVRTSRLRALLRLPNRVLKAKHGLSSAILAKLRKEFGFGRPPVVWSKEVLARLGKEPDTTVARRVGVTPGAVAHRRRRLGIPACGRSARRWTKAEHSWLGRLTDQEVAHRLGINASSVWTERVRLGIPKRGAGRQWTSTEDRLLGRLLDGEVARRLGIQTHVVRRRRQRLGIPGASRKVGA